MQAHSDKRVCPGYDTSMPKDLRKIVATPQLSVILHCGSRQGVSSHTRPWRETLFMNQSSLTVSRTSKQSVGRRRVVVMKNDPTFMLSAFIASWSISSSLKQVLFAVIQHVIDEAQCLQRCRHARNPIYPVSRTHRSTHPRPSSHVGWRQSVKIQTPSFSCDQINAVGSTCPRSCAPPCTPERAK